MARVLIAWELGANGGHGVKLAAVGRALVARGHQVDFALQRLDAGRSFRDLAEAPGARLWQAPFWPGLMRRAGPVASWGDVLAEAGMTDSGVLDYILRGWETLLAAAAPDLVICEFAPAAQLASFGRLPVVALGTGYTVPPSGPGGFAPFLGDRPRFDETALLRLVNHALSRLGRPALPNLAAIARADLHLPATFPELDPYHRPDTLAPFLNGAAPEATGDALFAYLPPAALPQDPRPLLQALRQLARARPVLLHAPSLEPPPGVQPTGALSQPEIAARAGAILGTGGLGLTSAALAMGLPQALIPTDAEKTLNGRAAEALGAALILPPEAPGILAHLLALPELAPRARALAPAFRARLDVDPAESALTRMRPWLAG